MKLRSVTIHKYLLGDILSNVHSKNDSACIVVAVSVDVLLVVGADNKSCCSLIPGTGSTVVGEDVALFCLGCD